jgi:hypothetical protein
MVQCLLQVSGKPLLVIFSCPKLFEPKFSAEANNNGVVEAF